MAAPSPNDPLRQRPPPVGPTVQPDPRVAEAARARTAATRAAPVTPQAAPRPDPIRRAAAHLDHTTGKDLLRGAGRLAVGVARRHPKTAAVLGAGTLAHAVMPTSWSDAIGAGVNEVVNPIGRAFGQDWGVDAREQPPAAPHPAQLRHQSIVNNPTQRGAAAPTLPPGAQQQAQTERTATFNDLSRELNAVPQNLPVGLRDGVVYRTVGPGGRVTFSGQNVREGAQMVDGQGRHLRNLGERGGGQGASVRTSSPDRERLIAAAQSGDITGLTPLQQRQAQMLRDGGAFDRAGNIVSRQTQENLARFAAQDAAAAAAQRQPVFQAGAPVVNQRWEALQKAKAAGVFQQRVNETGRNYRARMNEMASVLGLDMADLGNERNNATSRANTVDSVRAQIETNRASNETSLRTNQLTNQTTRRGQDLEAQERQLAREATLRERQALGQIWRDSEGNARNAADAALRDGRDASAFLRAAEAGQGMQARDRESALQRFESFMPTDDEGNITEAGRASIAAAVDKAFPGFFQLSQPEQAEHFPSVAAQLQILQGANETRDAFTWPAILGGSRGRPALTAPPANLPGGELRNANIWERMSSDVDAGDYTLRTGSGQRIFLPRERVDQNVLSELARQDVDVRQIPR